MVTTNNTSLILASYPKEYPIPGVDLQLSNSPIDLTQAPPEGGLLLKTNYVSYDPYLRGKMKPVSNPYTENFKVNEPLYNNAISTVIASSSPRFKKGDVVVGSVNFSDYNIISAERAAEPGRTDGTGGFYLLENPLGLAPDLFLGALGMSGLTAYSALYEIGKLKKGDVFFISAAAGSVGQIAGQIAKRLGAKVIGSVGSDEKLQWILDELKFDAGFNYKTEEPKVALKRILAELGEPNISVFWDNVGGETLDAAIDALKVFGVIISSGNISQSSRPDGQKYGVQNIPQFPGKRLKLQGFLVFDDDFGPKYSEEHQRNFQKWIKNGELIVKSHITEGWENAADGFLGLLQGKNFGKAVLKIADL